MERRQLWIAAAAVMLTVILSVSGATWWVGRNMATREDMTELRNELRNEITVARDEIRATRESVNAQMEELRGYIVQHLEQHSGNVE